MSSLIVLLIAGVVIFIGVAAAIAAIIIVSVNAKKQKSSPEVVVTAKVIRTYANEQAVYSVDSSSASTSSTYYAEFQLDDKSRLKFKINKKMFLGLHDGDTGTLVYKGTKVIRFQ